MNLPKVYEDTKPGSYRIPSKSAIVAGTSFLQEPMQFARTLPLVGI